MKLGFIGDLHMDYNHHHDFLATFVRLLNDLKLDTIIFCGDTTTGAFKALSFYEALQKEVETKVLAIPGNHELYCLGEGKGDGDFFCMDADDYQNLILTNKAHSLYLNPIAKNDWVIIGGPSWYDYSLHKKYEFMSEVKKNRFLTKNPEYKYIQDTTNSPKINEQITKSSLALLEAQLRTIRERPNGEKKKICSVIHMLPLKELYPEKPIFNTTIAFMGSKYYSALYEKYKVDTCVCAHSHQRMTYEKNGVNYINVSLGHNFKWKHKTDLYLELLNAIYLMNL